MNLEELYAQTFGSAPTAVAPLAQQGSGRRYFRLSGPVSAVGVIGTDPAENQAFIYLSRHFAERGLNVPQVLAESPDSMLYLQTDLGDRQLFKELDNEEALVATMHELARLHSLGAEGIDWKKCYPVEKFDEQAAMWDLNYFKYSFLNPSGLHLDEPRLEAEFQRLASLTAALTESDRAFMMRDCQSRNVMISGDKPYFIDFQGGRMGPAAYDVASFLWQAKAGFSDEKREQLIGEYVKAASSLRPISPEVFLSQVHLMAFLRSLQVLGAYGLRGLFERKPHFLQSIPGALKNLDALTAEFAHDFPYLREISQQLSERYAPTPSDGFEGLTVRVTSFSFKKGIPADPSGNGGGFVFDCRAMDNPGRYEEYKKLTGLDQPVIDFLESRGEIQKFLGSCYSLIDEAVTNYLERGFSSLCVNFGCTGGQHRSVYSAEHMAHHLKEKFPQVRVLLCHRERQISRVL